MRPPSLSPSFHILLPLKIFPKNKITGKASMGKRMMYGANSNAGVVAIVSIASDPAIVPPQFLRTLTSSSVIDSCCPYMARKMANPMATSDCSDGDGENGVNPPGGVAVMHGSGRKLHVGCVEHQFNAHEDDDRVLSGERSGKTDDEQEGRQTGNPRRIDHSSSPPNSHRRFSIRSSRTR